MKNLSFLLKRMHEILYLTLNLVLFCYAFVRVVQRTHSLDEDYKKSRITKALQVMGLILLLAWIQDSTELIYLMPAIVFFTYAFTFVVEPFQDSQLSIVPSIFSDDSVQIHLSNPGQAFNRETYQELPKLVKVLKKRGVKTITLTSPMFYKNSGLRSSKRLSRVLKPYVISIEHQKVNMFKLPGSVATMFMYKYILRKKTLSNTNLTLWYRYTINL